MKKIIQLKLKILAKMILAKYKPGVIGITGSVGKTSAKEAIFSVLSSKYKVRKNIKNYNNEIGVPLTVIGTNSPGKSLYGWLRVFSKAIKLLLIRDKEYPKILVLEMGADKPGDLAYLTSFIKIQIGVITLIGPVHLEFFGSMEEIIKEKSILLKNLNKTGWAILNNDDENVKKMADRTAAKTITYGLQNDAIVKAQEIVFSMSNDEKNNIGLSFKLSYQGSAIPVFLPKVIGTASVYAALAGAAVGVIQGMNLVEISQALKNYNAPRGRMNLINGIKNTLIIDDTYNASPQSSIVALETLAALPLAAKAVKYAVLGDMLELGSYSITGHELVGKNVVKNRIDNLIVVGERSRDIARGAVAAGMSKDNIFHFDNSDEVGKFIQDRISENNIILVKGSQGMRMEKIVKEIMAEPLRAKKLLVRQDEEWEKR